jgi:hypothetical protein
MASKIFRARFLLSRERDLPRRKAVADFRRSDTVLPVGGWVQILSNGCCKILAVTLCKPKRGRKDLNNPPTSETV